MNRLPEIFIRRPVTTFMLFTSLVILGMISLANLSIDLLPQIEFPAVTVMTTYENVGPEEIEKIITEPIEAAVGTVQGVERIESVSSEGSSKVQLRFAWGTSLDGAVNDVRAAVERIRAILPEGADTPVVFKFDLSSFPIMLLTLFGNMPEWKLRKIADTDLKYRLERLDGVASVDIRGGLKREIHVDIEPAKISSHGVTINQVIAALKRDNMDFAAGDVRDKGYEVIVKTMGEFRNLNQLADTVVDVKGKLPLKVRDIAIIRDSFEKPTNSVFINGKTGVRLAILKLPGANTVKVSELVDNEIKKINSEIPEIQLGKRFDTAQFIKSSISNIKQSLLIGAFLAIVILLLFLRKLTPTIIVATAIPISVLGTFAFMFTGGFTLNMVTLGGIAIGLGMLVDNSIVVMENIHNYTEAGLSAKDSAIKGVSEVVVAISASTLTTICIFVPVIFIQGLGKIIFGQLAWVVTFSLLCSLAVSLTLVPVMASLTCNYTGGNKTNIRKKTIAKAVNFLFTAEQKMLDWYEMVVRKALRKRLYIYLIAIFLLLVSLMLGRFVGKELMPETDQREISIDGELPVGTPLEKTKAVVKKLENIIYRNIPDLEMVMGVAGPPGYWSSAGANGIHMRIALKNNRSSSISTQEAANRIRFALANIPDLKPRVRLNEGFFIFRLLRGGGERLSVEIYGYDIEEMMNHAKKVASIIKSVRGITDVDIDMKEGGTEANIYVDPIKAADMGFSIGDIGRTISAYVMGAEATTYREEGEEYIVRVQLEEKECQNRSQLETLPLITPSGKHIKLGDVAKIKHGFSPVSIKRLNRKRIITVSGGFSGRDLGSIVKDVNRKLSELGHPEGLTVKMGGEYEEQQKTFKSFAIGLLLAIILVYMVMASLFESFLHPLIILLSIPFAAIGVTLTLLSTKTTLNIYSFLGIIVLVGVVVNNAIVLVDYINLLRNTYGLNLTEAVVKGARRRLRPILMTTLTTVLALLPVAAGIGEGSEMQSPLARVIAGGLLSSALITLLVVPCLYFTFESWKGEKTH